MPALEILARVARLPDEAPGLAVSREAPGMAQIPPSLPGPRLSESSHPRSFRQNRFVYPVLSRRSGGVSIGINLNPDKACNFGCLYCQVDRSKVPQDRFVESPALLDELRSVLEGLRPGGALWREAEFAGLEGGRRRVCDVAFSGDGEPTTYRDFSELVRQVVELKEGLGFEEAKVVLITNATGFGRPEVQEGLRYLDGHRGEVWAKLDAGTEEYFRQIDHTDFPFAKLLELILWCARLRPVVIQSCFMRVRGQGPDEAEVGAYLGRLRALAAAGGRIQAVQVYTIARPPSYSIVSSLSQEEVDRIALRVRQEAGLPALGYYGQVGEGAGLLGLEPLEGARPGPS